MPENRWEKIVTVFLFSLHLENTQDGKFFKDSFNLGVQKSIGNTKFKSCHLSKDSCLYWIRITLQRVLSKMNVMVVLNPIKKFLWVKLTLSCWNEDKWSSQAKRVIVQKELFLRTDNSSLSLHWRFWKFYPLLFSIWPQSLPWPPEVKLWTSMTLSYNGFLMYTIFFSNIWHWFSWCHDGFLSYQRIRPIRKQFFAISSSALQKIISSKSSHLVTLLFYQIEP